MQCSREEVKDMMKQASGAARADPETVRAGAKRFLDKQAEEAALLEQAQMNVEAR